MGKLIHIKMDDEDLGTCPLHEYMEMEESLTIPEMYALNTLAVGDTYAIGVHTGYAYITRLHDPHDCYDFVEAGFDPDMLLGDYYYCGRCDELLQVG